MKLTRQQLRQLEDAGVEVSGRHKSKRPAKPEWKGDPRKHCKKGERRPEAHVIFDVLCKAHGIPIPDHEYQFCPGRKWRFDKCWGEFDLALEIQGGVFVEGRHAQGAALLKEYEKLNAAVCEGWFVLFCTPEDVESGAIFATIKKAMGLSE